MSIAQGEPAPSGVGAASAAVTNASGARREPPEVRRLPDLDLLLARSEQLLPGLRPDWIGIEHVGRADSTVSVYGDVDPRTFGTGWVVFSASDARVLGAHGLRDAGVYERFDAWFHGLHYGCFGGNAIKLLYALLALATCGVILTGNVVWLERRDLQRQQRGNRWLERLSVGVCAGVVLATACTFAANRLLAALARSDGIGAIAPAAATAAIEHGVFWASGLIAVALPFASAARPRRVAGLELLLAAGALTLAVSLDVGMHGVYGALRSGVPSGLVALAMACALGGYLIGRSPVKAVPSDRHAPASEPDAAHHEAG